jgi:hypothetical protein
VCYVARFRKFGAVFFFGGVKEEGGGKELAYLNVFLN